MQCPQCQQDNPPPAGFAWSAHPSGADVRPGVVLSCQRVPRNWRRCSGREWQQGDMVQHRTLIVEDLHMTYQTADGPVRAVQGVSFTIPAGEFYTLLGASGCGKTTILRCVAGLEAERGRIVVGDTVVCSSAEH